MKLSEPDPLNLEMKFHATPQPPTARGAPRPHNATLEMSRYGRTKPDDMSQEEWDAWWEENGDYVKRTETEGTVTCLGPATHDVINQVLAELQDEVRTKGEEIEKLRQERYNYKDMTDAELDREYDMMLEEITRRFGPEKVRTTPRQKHP